MAELRNEAMRNAQMQGAIKQIVKLNYEYMIRNNIDWADYVNQLKDNTNKSRLIDKYYIPYCEKIELDTLPDGMNNIDEK
jgi:hypothetical protein